MKKPNFFLIGAPKCGTTSMAAWLSHHSQVFISQIKEPHFFSFDYGDRRVASLRSYEKLFRAASSSHIAVGEASTGYLYSRTAVPAICAYAVDPRIIVMIRDPIEMVCSLHQQRLFEGQEQEREFDVAWRLQGTRIFGGNLPKRCTDPQYLFYGSICRVGEQLRRVCNLVGQNRVLVIRLDQIQRDPGQECKRVLEFLGLDGEKMPVFPILNRSPGRTHSALWSTLSAADQLLRDIKIKTPRLGIMEHFHNRFSQMVVRQQISAAMRAELVEYFSEDIQLIENLTGFELSAWRSTARKSRQP